MTLLEIYTAGKGSLFSFTFVSLFSNYCSRTFPVELMPVGLGEKILLRCLAHGLGLKNAALLKKKALQFGSKIANSKENANDVSQRLL